MFSSRTQAGELLAQELSRRGYKKNNTVVLAIPRGGVVVGRAVADYLEIPIDIIVTRKIPAPNQPELAIGAVGPRGLMVLDFDLAKRSGATREYLREKENELKSTVEIRNKKLRGDKKPEKVRGKVVIIVDDGIATGATFEAAIRYVRNQKPQKIVLAAPVSSVDSAEGLSTLVDDMVILDTPEDFRAVGQFYENFPQVSDEEVVKLLQ